MSQRSPEELTELETVIDADIRSASADGFVCKVYGENKNDCAGDFCPLAAVAKSRSLWRGWNGARDALRITEKEMHGFVAGFDAWELENPWSLESPDLYAMGARFRERVLAGDYRHVG